RRGARHAPRAEVSDGVPPRRRRRGGLRRRDRRGEARDQRVDPRAESPRRDRHHRAADLEDRPLTVTGHGQVVAFDEDRGLGELTDDDGTTLGSHCTAIADGTRTIEVGTLVTFDAVAGALGTYEAANVRREG